MEPVQAAFRRQGVLTARELATELGVSQPTVSRLISRQGARQVVRIAGGRSTRYGLRRPVRGSGSEWPLYCVTAAGDIVHAGCLYALEGGSWHVSQDNPWESLRAGDFRYGIYPGLPWFLQDLRPRGFLGRCFARRVASELGCSPDPRRWNDDDVLTALTRFGEDLPGSFVVGDRMLAAVQSADSVDAKAISTGARETAYPALAEATLAGQWPGSSAAGEQPKFTACTRDSVGATRHVIVKFSGRRDRPENRRWADLLVAENVANAVLSEAGIPCASTCIVESGSRRFLESIRFDRVGARGRRGLISLEALDAAYFGAIDTPWTAAAERLRADAWVSAEDTGRLSLLWWFGSLIGNTDMHYGNLSLFLSKSRPLSLAPVYDMVPMCYRPDPEGRLPTEPLDPAPPPPQARSVWVRAGELAERFWMCMARRHLVSSEFQALAERNAELLSGSL